MTHTTVSTADSEWNENILLHNMFTEWNSFVIDVAADDEIKPLSR